MRRIKFRRNSQRAFVVNVRYGASNSGGRKAKTDQILLEGTALLAEGDAWKPKVDKALVKSKILNRFAEKRNASLSLAFLMQRKFQIRNKLKI